MLPAHPTSRLLRSGLAVCLSACCLLAVGARIRYIRPSALPRYGRYTAEQILERSEPLCRSVAPEAGKLLLSVEPLCLPNRLHVFRPFWQVYCYDEAGRDVCYLLWNALDGEICTIEPRKPMPKRPARLPLDRDSALSSAMSWLRVLPATCSTAAWVLRREPMRTEGTWFTFWRDGSRRAAVAIDARTGGLVKLDSFPPPGRETGARVE